MSAYDYYQPHVYIDGERLNETRGLDGLTPVADIKIPWGGRDWYENIDPSRLSLVLLDPYGELLNLRSGAEITVTIDPDNRVMFRGNLIASRATYAAIANRNGKNVPVWRVEVDAYDPLSTLAGDRKHGPTYASRNGQVNLLHWGRSTIAERFTDLQARSPAPIMFRYADWMSVIDETLAPQDDLAVLPYTVQQNVSVLTVLRRSARIEHPMNRPFFDPERGEIRLLKPATASVMPTRNATVSVSGGKVILNRAVSTIPAIEIESGQLHADAGKITLDLKEYNNVNRCVLKASYTIMRPADPDAGIYGTHYEIREPSNPITLTAGLGEGSTVELETDFIFTQNPNVPPLIYQGISTLMLATDRWRQIPQFSFSVPRDRPIAAPLSALFRAAPTFNRNTDVIDTFIITGSPLQWSGTAPSFSVVGGELRYTRRKGWVVTCSPALQVTRPEVGLRLGDVTLTNPISATHPRYTVGDFQLL